MTFSDNAPPGMKASMLHDLEAGNRLELDWLTGKIVALGKELGVPTPGSDAVYAAVKLHRMGKQGKHLSAVIPARALTSPRHARPCAGHPDSSGTTLPRISRWPGHRRAKRRRPSDG